MNNKRTDTSNNKNGSGKSISVSVIAGIHSPPVLVPKKWRGSGRLLTEQTTAELTEPAGYLEYLRVVSYRRNGEEPSELNDLKNRSLLGGASF